MQTDPALSGPDFLQAVAETELAHSREINAATWRARAKEWQQDRADLAEAKARIAILESRLAAASTALAA